MDPPLTWGFEILLGFTFNLHSHLIKKKVWGTSNWKVFKGDKICKISKIFKLKSYFSIRSSKKSTPPTWGFEIVLKFTFNLHLHLIKKNQFGVCQIGKCSKETKFVKYRKF